MNRGYQVVPKNENPASFWTTGICRHPQLQRDDETERGEVSTKAIYVLGYVLALIVLKSRKLPPFSIGFQTAVIAFEY